MPYTLELTFEEVSAGEFRFDAYTPLLDTREIFPVGAPWGSVTKSYDPGEDVYVHYAVKNIGAEAGEAAITVKDLDTGAVVTTWSIPELGPGERFKTKDSGAYVGKISKDWHLEFKVEP